MRILDELWDPWAILVAIAAGVVAYAASVPWPIALAAAVAVLCARVAAGLLVGVPLPAAPILALPAPAEAGAGPGGALTRKELEIAQLVSEGHTNREIADRLVISERTVDNHVQHILTKLDFHRRSQIAAWWAEHRMSTRK
jgi:DNA-binding CsgD family transcriptional regulator